MTLVRGLVDAIAQDSGPEAGGFDLEAGMIGPSLSEWMRSVAEQLDQNAITLARTYGVLYTLNAYSAFDVSGAEADRTFVNAKKESVALLKDLVVGTSYPTAAVLDAVDSSMMISKLRDCGEVLSVWSVEDLDFLNDESDTSELTDFHLSELKRHFLNECGSGLVDRLAESGNDALATYWQMHKEQLIAKAAATPEPDGDGGEPSRAEPVDSLRGG